MRPCNALGNLHQKAAKWRRHETCAELSNEERSIEGTNKKERKTERKCVSEWVSERENKQLQSEPLTDVGFMGVWETVWEWVKGSKKMSKRERERISVYEIEREWEC